LCRLAEVQMLRKHQEGAQFGEFKCHSHRLSDVR
jgi:hypothetical protein